MEEIYHKEIIKKILLLRNNFKVKKIGGIKFGGKNYPIFVIESKTIEKNKKNVFISAGLHGDELGGVYAVINFLRNNAKNFSQDFNFFVSPCLNPTGLDLACRYNCKGQDLNRDFKRTKTKEVSFLKKYFNRKNIKFHFSLDIHEDNTLRVIEGLSLDDNPKGVYLYEVCFQGRHSKFGVRIMDELRNKKVRITRKKQVYGEICQGGIIFSSGISPSTYADPNAMEGFAQKYMSYALTSEVPTFFPLNKRLNIHKKIISSCLEVARQQ